MNAINVACVVVYFLAITLDTPTVAHAIALEETVEKTIRNGDRAIPIPDNVCSSGAQCNLTDCCLRPYGRWYPYCHPMLRNGEDCSWSHFTEKQPLEQITEITCPCSIGLVCLDFGDGRSMKCTNLT